MTVDHAASVDAYRMTRVSWQSCMHWTTALALVEISSPSGSGRRMYPIASEVSMTSRSDLRGDASGLDWCPCPATTTSRCLHDVPMPVWDKQARSATLTMHVLNIRLISAPDRKQTANLSPVVVPLWSGIEPITSLIHSARRHSCGASMANGSASNHQTCTQPHAGVGFAQPLRHVARRQRA